MCVGLAVDRILFSCLSFFPDLFFFSFFLLVFCSFSSPSLFVILFIRADTPGRVLCPTRESSRASTVTWCLRLCDLVPLPAAVPNRPCTPRASCRGAAGADADGRVRKMRQIMVATVGRSSECRLCGTAGGGQPRANVPVWVVCGGLPGGLVMLGAPCWFDVWTLWFADSFKGRP